MNDIAIGIIITFLFVCMAILFCAILIKVYVAKIKKYNQLLFDKQLEQQKAVNLATLEAQDTTLNNLATELHDDAGQQLTYLNMQLEQIKLNKPELLNDVEPLSTTVSELATSIRQLSHSITSASLNDHSLLEIIDRELNKVNKLNLVQCTMNVEQGKAYTFTPNEKIIHYRIFQEVLNNMLKHSRAKTFIISIENPERPILSYVDNGRGFDTAANHYSSGLRNLKQRASLINYDLEVVSEANKGTSTTLSKINN